MANPSNYPSSVADLNFVDTTTTSQNLWHTLADLKRSTLSLSNRLSSIEQDAAFVLRVAQHCALPLVANERCGSWYIPTDKKVDSAYFKSTDGHVGQWSFSLRRLNLQILALVGRTGGCVIVDSTRRGKSMPDAFSKTIPIWTTVMNRSLFPEAISSHHLQAPHDVLGTSEVSQIETRLDAFVASFKSLNLDLWALRDTVKLPLKVHWVTQDETYTFEHEEQVNHLILCSASRRVNGTEVSGGGYIQGAGDDSEAWASGLTPEMYWGHRDRLRNTPEAEWPDLIATLGTGIPEKSQPGPILINPTTNLYVRRQLDEEPSLDGNRLEVRCHGDPATESTRTRLVLGCDVGKLGSRDLRQKLVQVMEFVTLHLSKDATQNLYVTCRTGIDLSVGVALAITCLSYNDSGIYVGLQPHVKIDKAFIRPRLAWIIASKADANPSRSTLQAVNSFLMGKPDKTAS